MGREVVWSKAASRDLAAVLEFLENNWPSTITRAFNTELRNQIEIIAAFPEIGESFVDDKLVRRILITKHNALFYDFDDSNIYILKIIDTRSSGYRSI